MMLPASTCGNGGGSTEGIELSSGGECGREVCVLTSGVAPLSWWFYGGLVSSLTSSVISSSLVWEKITVGRSI